MPDVFPVMFDKKAAVPMPLPMVVGTESQVDYDPDTLLPMSLPVVVETRPQVGCESDLLLSERDMEVDDTDVIRDI